jgi:hypothetical protein
MKRQEEGGMGKGLMKIKIAGNIDDFVWRFKN